MKTKPYIAQGTINAQNCLKERLLPFIRKHNSPVIFWPDLASCHHANAVMEWYENEGVNVVPKECNPPKSPEIRPIETYWALIKRRLLLDGARVNSITAL